MQRQIMRLDLFFVVFVGFFISIMAIIGPTSASAGWADDVKGILLESQVDQSNEDSDFELIYEEEGNVTEEDVYLPTSGGRVHRPDENTAARLFYDRMVYIMGNMRDTKYVHHKDKVMDDDEGVYKYDCSGFVGEFILKQVLPNHYQDLVDNAERFHADSHPRAWGFYDYFREILGDSDENSNAYWYVFKSIEKIQPGDIIVARYDDAWRDFMKGKECKHISTGHVMVAWSFPVISDCTDNERWIYVIDSSGSGHAKDTRRTTYDDVNDETGIGKGKMWYGINQDDKRPIYYRWSKSKCQKGCKYTLHSMSTNCTVPRCCNGKKCLKCIDFGGTFYCDGENYFDCFDCDADKCIHNGKYFERLQGIILARPIFP